MRAILLVGLLVAAACLVTVGVAMLSTPAGFIVAGFMVAVLAVFGLADLS